MPHREIVEDLSGQCQPGYCTLYEVLKLAGIDIPAEVQWTGDCRVHGCPLKDHVLRSGLRDRELEELKCIEIFKYNSCAPEKPHPSQIVAAAVQGRRRA